MARTVNQWRREVTKIMEGEGLTNIRLTTTNGTHLRATGLLNGREVSMTCSLSPSCNRAGHHARKTLRHVIKEQPQHVQH